MMLLANIVAVELLRLLYAIGIFYILLLFADSKLVFNSIGALLIERAHCVRLVER